MASYFWPPVEATGSGDVVGPASSTDNAVARYNGTTGKLLQGSAVTIDDSGNIATAGTVDGRDVSVDGSTLDSHTAASTGVHGVTGSVVGTTDTQTLSAKTLTSPVINTGVSGTAVLDDDTMSTASNTTVATSESIKAYVDAGDSTNSGALTTHISDTTTHGTTGDIVGTTDTQTLSGKTIDADVNTISNLAHGAEVDNPSSGVHGVTGNVVGTTDTQTLSAKTLTSPVINTSVSGTAILDEDTMSSNSDTKLATQQSIKAYYDNTNKLYSAKSADYTILDNDNIITLGMTTGSSTDKTVTLPTASDNTNRIITVIKVDSGTNDCIVSNETPTTLATLSGEGATATFQSDGTNWVILQTMASDTQYGLVKATSGTYTPTVTNIANAGGTISQQKGFYHLINGVVHVTGYFEVSLVTDATTHRLQVSLPFAKTVASIYDITGVVGLRRSTTYSNGGGVYGYIAGNTAEIAVYSNSGSSASHAYYFQFAYEPD